MSKNLFALFFIFSSFIFCSNAQNDETVSNNHEQIISNLIESSINHRDSSKNISVQICDKAINVAEREQADSLLALAFKTQGVNYYYMKEYDSSMVYYNKAVFEFKQLGNMIQVGKTLGNIGVIYKIRGKYSKALEYYLKSELIWEILL